MSLLDQAHMVDAKRFETIAHAVVLTSGRLRFATDAMAMMNLETVKGVILFSMGGRALDDHSEFLAVTCTEDDPRAFSLKTSGPYRYLSLKNFLLQQQINFKDFSTSFEVTEVNEKFENDKPVFRLVLRQTPRAKGGMNALKAALDAENPDMPF